MLWMTEKKVFHHFLDLGFERVEIPIRVKFQFSLLNGSLVPDSLSKDILYNRSALENRYPDMDGFKLQRSIEQKVDQEILKYFKACGFLREEDTPKPKNELV
jgi:hypothetical protein